jgi:hypothetical protein
MSEPWPHGVQQGSRPSRYPNPPDLSSIDFGRLRDGRTNIGYHLLEPQTYRTHLRFRSSGGIITGVHVRDLPDGRYVAIWGFPKPGVANRVGLVVVFDTLVEALRWANQPPRYRDPRDPRGDL